MREVDRLVAEVERTIEGDPWYGSSLLRILEGLNASAAAAHPIDGAHSIWELVLHMTAWTHEATRRLRGGLPGEPAEGDWPPVAGTDATAWRDAVGELRNAHADLARTLARLDDVELGRQVAGTQVDDRGTPVTIHRTVVGMLQHDAYHTGQVALLKKVVATKGGPTS